MRTTYNLPEEIILPTGETLKPVIGGCLANEPFCDVRETFDSEARERIIAEAKRRKLKHRVIGVLHRNLRGKLDLHGTPYRPTVWTFVQVRKETNANQTAK